MVASAKASLSERSGRGIEQGQIRPVEAQERHWRTREAPFAGVWEEAIVPLLEPQPTLSAITRFEDLQERHPGD